MAHGDMSPAVALVRMLLPAFSRRYLCDWFAGGSASLNMLRHVAVGARDGCGSMGSQYYDANIYNSVLR